MRAVQVTRFGGPEVLAVAGLANPVAEPGQVVVDVDAVEVLFLDTQCRAGWGQEYFSFQPPYVPGTGVVGVVTALGDGVDERWRGRSVVVRTGDGGAYVERVAVAAGDLFEVPAALDGHAALAALHDGPTALSRFENSGIEKGSRVLVTAAAGSLGSWLVPLAHAAGAHVVAAVRGEAKQRLALEHGADAVVDYSEPDWGDKVRAETGGNGVDVVFDGVGGAVGGSAYRVTADGSRFFSYGAASGDFAEIDPDDAARRGITVVGIGQLTPDQWTRLTEQALEELASGNVTAVIGQMVPLERAGDAHAAIEARTVLGKTVLTVDRQ
ncbi:NADPH2:quinone reductase [Haloactinopolyspora alba]|uniref:NADPH2:quinone reductase n=1 Tax=Haloactinopolyspora alba TaxID=648780 RepID=A0A2P8DWK3_9ACTN|nr:zinc-binding dehydrogenase [Haloactinopolyspora alba]PSL01582.1 NADPH2:quinone reductase [Haloactinopolyspora alba]